jgi:imidazolonepropionase-like amidohydrolase
MSVIPTLQLFSRNRNLEKLLAQLDALKEAGVPILFGTDVGFLTDYDPAREYQLMDQAGLNFPQILTAVTTAPAARYGFSQHKGRVAAGMDADLVVLGSDPAEEVSAWTDVRYTIRKGEIAYAKQQ